ncbi:hypothetical protein OG21DRAFT_1482231 [Imleria badia]|nr:hypothetical protein OG21DRAFT_1482231 [Imleria badia]
MADNTERPAFEFTGDIISIILPNTWNGAGKKPKISTDAGVYRAVRPIQRWQGQSPGNNEKFLHVKNPNIYLTLDALNNRLENAERRRADCLALRAADDARPVELWDKDGTYLSIPARLIPTGKAYNDGTQLQRWIDVAKNLYGKPPTHINPAYARFMLKPSETLKKNITVYFTPASSPLFHVDVEKLTAIITANQARFSDWPQWQVITYTAAQEMGLKLVGQNFLKIYFTWMEVDHYTKLWKEFGVSALLHAFPVDGDEPPAIYERVNKRLWKSTTNFKLDRREIMVTWKKIRSARGNREGSTATIMGESATRVAPDLWGDDFITTGMGHSKVEWLHRVACAFGGLDESVSLATSNDVNNLVFGTWECNTNMLRVENLVTELTKQDNAMGSNGYKGKLMTINKSSGNVDRAVLEKENQPASIPKWAAKTNYSWLCLSLGYVYSMKEAESPLRRDFIAEIDFDPWSLYVPLSIEPRLDMMIVDNLKLESAPMAHSSAEHCQAPDIPLPKRNFEEYSPNDWHAPIEGVHYLKRPNFIPANSPDTPVSNGGCIFQGEVLVFGGAVHGDLEKWIGPAPDDVVLGTDPPSIERVTVEGDFHMSMLIPLLQSTPFANIIFRNVAFYHQNYAFDKTKSIGWHFNADLVIDYSCGLLYQILTQVLQVDNPVLSIHNSFGYSGEQHWNAPLRLHTGSFILDGIFPNDAAAIDIAASTSSMIPLLHSSMSFAVVAFPKEFKKTYDANNLERTPAASNTLPLCQAHTHRLQHTPAASNAPPLWLNSPPSTQTRPHRVECTRVNSNAPPQLQTGSYNFKCAPIVRNAPQRVEFTPVARNGRDGRRPLSILERPRGVADDGDGKMNVSSQQLWNKLLVRCLIVLCALSGSSPSLSIFRFATRYRSSPQSAVRPPRRHFAPVIQPYSSKACQGTNQSFVQENDNRDFEAETCPQID